MKRIVMLLSALMLTLATLAQSYNDAFYDALNDGDLAKQRQVLNEWKQASPDDVDWYIANYNFYANRAIGLIEAGGLTLEGAPEEVQDIVTNGLRVYDEAVADSGLATIQAGIDIYPKRLDMRFGKIYFLGQLARWDAFADEIIHTINYSEQIDHKWVYPNYSDSFTLLMQESLLDYQQDMFGQIEDVFHLSMEDSAMVMRIRRVAQRTVQVFPRDIYAINILGVTYNMMKAYSKSIDYFLRAEKIDPNDVTVLQNIADTYKHLGKKKQAKEYQDRLKALEEQEE